MKSAKSMPRIRQRQKMMTRRRLNLLTIACITLLIILVITSLTSLTSSFSSPKGASDTDIWVKTDAQNFNENNIIDKVDPDHLIMVAGHSVIIGGHLQDAGVDEKDWYLLSYQKGHGLPQAIVAHIREGIRLAASDERSLLIFSGGETRPSTGPISEGSSYFHVADAMHLWNEFGGNSSSTVRARTVSEEFATDSFQNLLFSICRFKEVTGHYPRKITVVSFSFKQRRFEELHATALQWPQESFEFVGYDPDASTGFDFKSASEGERTNSAVPFETDPYGCNSEILKEKRIQRNPFSRTPPYELTCPDLKELLFWCGPDIIPSSKVPW